MSRADELFIQNCKDILENGVWDTDRAVRTRWDDGTPAHTIKKFCILCQMIICKMVNQALNRIIKIMLCVRKSSTCDRINQTFDPLRF